MYRLLRSLLFLSAPETVHYWAMRQLQRVYGVLPLRRIAARQYAVRDKSLERTLWGLHFPNPVGLAAGFDKDARWTDELGMLGFGFVEIGTLTPRPQPGNDAPRLFRLPADKALINRMGFNNGGADAAAERLRHRRDKKLIIGGNIGKNKDTPNEDAADDYEKAFRSLYDVVDYFVVNVSSPNTPGLRALQDRTPLTALLQRLQSVNTQLGKKPLLLKIAPDLTAEQLDDIIAIIGETALDGIVATNTTIDRSGLGTPPAEVEAIGAGGVSGEPLRARATEVVRYLHQKSGGAIPVIAAGGIFTAADAKEKLDAGAVLVQVYTGFVYEGPGIAGKICRGLLG